MLGDDEAGVRWELPSFFVWFVLEEVDRGRSRLIKDVFSLVAGSNKGVTESISSSSAGESVSWARLKEFINRHEPQMVKSVKTPNRARIDGRMACRLDELFAGGCGSEFIRFAGASGKESVGGLGSFITAFLSHPLNGWRLKNQNDTVESVCSNTHEPHRDRSFCLSSKIRSHLNRFDDYADFSGATSMIGPFKKRHIPRCRADVFLSCGCRWQGILRDHQLSERLIQTAGIPSSFRRKTWL